MSQNDLMARRRNSTRLFWLTKGQGRLTQALDIDKRYDGLDLCGQGPLWLEAAEIPVGPNGPSVRGDHPGGAPPPAVL